MKNTNNSASAKGVLRKRMTDIRVGKGFWLSVVNILMGFLLPRVTVCGEMCPFGVGLAAAVSGPTAVPVFLSVFIGYLLNDIASALRYLTALVAVVGLKWSVSGFPSVTASRYFAPTVTFLGTLITGSALMLTGARTLSDVIFVIAESIIGAGFCTFCVLFFEEMSQNSKKRIKKSVKFGTLIMITVMTMVTLTLEWQGISLGRILITWLVLTAAHCAGVRGGVLVGCLLGLGAFLYNPSELYLVTLYTFGGLLAGALREKGRLISSLIFIAVYVIVSVAVNPQIGLPFVIGLYEISAATVFLFLLPKHVKGWILQLVDDREVVNLLKSGEIVASKMKKAADTMSRVAGTVDGISREFAMVSAPSIGSMYRSLSEGCCHNCKRRFLCWEKHFSNVMDSFNHITPELKNKGMITVENITGYLKENCIKQEAICDAVNNRYREFLIREAAFQRLCELRSIINDQFENTAQLLTEFSQQFKEEEWNDSASAQKISTQLKKDNIPLQNVYCHIKNDGHMEIELVLENQEDAQHVSYIHEQIESVCERHFAPPTVECENKQTRLFLSEGQVYRTVIGTSQSRCKGEELCGDAFEIFRDANGCQFVVLSDGMGTGGRAAVDGAMTAGLTSEMLKAGFGYESILRIINTALMAKSGDETLATLDIACINLFTGDIDILKAGAGISLLLSKERVFRIDESSLPLGILRELTFARTHDRLVEGDVLLMMSDGISNEDMCVVEDKLRSFNTQDGNVQSLSQHIIETAKKLSHDDKGDDMTVIVVKLEKTQ